MDEDNIVSAVQLPQRPLTQDRIAWAAYWKAQGQSWRTEPEIDAGRQAFLAGSRAIVPDFDEGIYPFKDVRLSRADIEWLLATHENGRGPVNIRDQHQLDRIGIDVRGADLRGVNLSRLPLARLVGGLNVTERRRPPEMKLRAAVHLEGAILNETDLEEAELYMAYMQRADLFNAHLAGASLRKAHLEGASLRCSYVGGVLLRRGHSTQQVQAVGNDHMRESPHREWLLLPTDLRAVFFDKETDLEDIRLGDDRRGVARLGDVHWSDVSLGVVDWSQTNLLGDEQHARNLTLDEIEEPNPHRRLRKYRVEHLWRYREAVRAYRQLAVALQERGLNEEAARFAFRAQRLQRTVFRLRKKLGAYIFSLFLELLAGYGYRPIRSLLAYLIVISSFAITYLILGQTVGPHLSPLGALVFSVTSFHGRGFFPGGIKLDDPITVLAALEAVVGLTIEISFISTFTQRFFGK